jgi:hypothetical protein
MADLLVAVSEGEVTFDPDDFAEPAAERWPTAIWYEPDPEDDLAVTMAKQLTVREDRRILTVDFLTNRQSAGIEGDDDLAAEFLALLTRCMPIPEDTIVVMNWADGVATLRANMTPDEVHALRV